MGAKKVKISHVLIHKIALTLYVFVKKVVNDDMSFKKY